MSKSAKRKGKVEEEEKKRAKGKAVAKGRLIALDGTKGHELEQGAEHLVHLLSRTNGEAGWSQWDASNTFYELRLGKSKHHAPPPRTLVLLLDFPFATTLVSLLSSAPTSLQSVQPSRTA